jgi:hypothetical protein
MRNRLLTPKLDDALPRVGEGHLGAQNVGLRHDAVEIQRPRLFQLRSELLDGSRGHFGEPRRLQAPQIGLGDLERDVALGGFAAHLGHVDAHGLQLVVLVDGPKAAQRLDERCRPEPSKGRADGEAFSAERNGERTVPLLEVCVDVKSRPEPPLSASRGRLRLSKLGVFGEHVRVLPQGESDAVVDAHRLRRRRGRPPPKGADHGCGRQTDSSDPR